MCWCKNPGTVLLLVTCKTRGGAEPLQALGSCSLLLHSPLASSGFAFAGSCRVNPMHCSFASYFSEKQEQDSTDLGTLHVCAHRLLPPFSADKQDMICKARKNLVLSICGLIKINENQGYHPCPSKCYPKKCRAEGVLW